MSEREPAEWETAHDCADEGPALDSPPDVPSYELEVVLRALHQQVRDDLWFAGELAARVLTPERRAQLQAAVEAQWPAGERDPDSPDYDSLTPFFAVDDAIDDEGWERIVELTGEVLQPLQCWDPRLIEHLGDAAVEHLCHLIGIPYVWTWSWRSELVHEIPEQRARTTGGRSASAPTPVRRFEDTTDHHFEFRFPAFLTLPAAERLIASFTAAIARELWDATGFKEKRPNAGAQRAVTTFAGSMGTPSGARRSKSLGMPPGGPRSSRPSAAWPPSWASTRTALRMAGARGTATMTGTERPPAREHGTLRGACP